MKCLPVAFRAILATAFFSSGSLAQTEPNAPASRVFETISVVGNERFRDEDILVTSGLETGQLLDRSDLVSAVEALEFTGEFKDVEISSDGPALTIRVQEAPEYSGGLTFGAGYDSDIGGFAAVGLSLENAFGKDTELSGNLLISEEMQTLSAQIRANKFWFGDYKGGIRVSYERYELDNTSYDFEAARIEPYVVFDLNEKALVELRYTLASKDISNVEATASPILQSESGQKVSSGFGFSLATGSSLFEKEGAGLDAWSIRFDQDFTGLGGDTDLSHSKLSVFARKNLSNKGFALRSRLEMGAVKGLGADSTRVSERFTLGGSSLRGFASGTIAPRDSCIGCAADGGDINTILGGDYYAVMRTDLLIPIFTERPEIETFLFFDVGSVWGLDTSVLPDGTLLNDRSFSRSTGIGASFDTKLGKFESYLALDADGGSLVEEQSFGLTFRSEF